MHGFAEAEDFINRGKYEQTEDSDGDICYQKKAVFEVEKKVHMSTAEVRSQSRCTKDKQEALIDEFSQWFEEGGAVLDKGLASMNKRPAAAAAITPRPGGKKAKKGAAALAAEGDDVDADEAALVVKAKTPIEEARSKASKMAQTMSLSSAKFLGVTAATDKDNRTVPLLSSIADTRKSLESKRGN